jgi:hypothetical protein
LTDLILDAYLGYDQRVLPKNQRVVLQRTHIYARPDWGSFDWAYLRRGITVQVEREEKSFTQVTYHEWDREPDRSYLSMCITGWAPDEVLTRQVRRHFYRLSYTGESPERWTMATDNHQFNLFWASLGHLPLIIPPQDAWLAYLLG